MLDIDLARASDEEVMASLTSVLGSPPEAETEYWYGEGGYDFRLVGYKLSAPASPAQIAQARAIMVAASQPLGRVDLAQELTKLRLAVVSNLRGGDLEGWMMVIMEDLVDFPAAVVIGACKAWRRREKYLPSSAELVDECHQLNRPRCALRRLVDGDRNAR